jgi:hypothetical protein
MVCGNFVSMYNKNLEIMEHRLHSLYLEGELYIHTLFHYCSLYVHVLCVRFQFK